LNCFSPESPELTAGQISRKSGIPLTTTYRILAGLTKGGFLKQNANKKYKIGADLYMLGSLYLDTTDITEVAVPVVKALNNLTDEAVNIGILDRGLLLVIVKEESRSAFRISVHIGSTMPAYSSAMGKALLSELDEAELDTLYPDEMLKSLTPKTIKTKSELKKNLNQIRETGISIADEESIDKVIGIGSVIRDTEGKATAALSISVPVFRINKATGTKIAKLVKMAADLISSRLGYRLTRGQITDVQTLAEFWQKEDTAT
jgi:DNA-binding IclR family transcriptional regulator